MSDKQRTIAKEVSISGKGLHSGQNVTLTFKPAEVNTGFLFRRIDIEGSPEIHALADNVVSTARGTTLLENNAEVMTVEHACAALYGLGIDNVVMDIDGPEVPIMHGSSREFLKALKTAGIEEQNAEREYFEVTEKMVLKQDGSEIILYPDDNYSIDVHIDYNSRVVGYQYATIDHIDEFEKEISACKTFVFLHELEFLAKNNLIKGGDLNNALVIVERKMEQDELDRLAELLHKPKVNVLPEGYLSNTELAFPNEPARHKLLDVIGDLSLAGKRLKCKVIARKPGHPINTAMAKQLRQIIKKQQLRPQAPKYDPNQAPVFDINDIHRLLPHRPPFLLVDKIAWMEGDVICGIKNVTMNEAFFVGHFPEEPIMPGVLQIEAMAQVGGILLMSRVPDPENYVMYFAKIEEVKFRNKVVPGDTLKIRMKLLAPPKHGIAKTSGQIFVGEELVVEAHFMAQMSKKPESN